MPRSFAASLGALAMAIVVLRGAVNGQPAGDVAAEAMVALVVFALIGFVAGWIADYLVRDSLEQSFRARVDWYRKGVVNAGLETQAKSVSESPASAVVGSGNELTNK